MKRWTSRPRRHAVSSREEVVDLPRIEGLPLNGRQFANLAATVPGVGLGVHSDPSKSAQHTPQISGGNGRNINTLVDGGDNNDDTVGGLLQLFPLEAIQEFNVLTQRFDAEYGRSSAVLNIVTKSGTNQLRGSWFTLMRDEALNAQTFSEKLRGVAKQPYRRVSVRRQPRRADRPKQDALLRRVRAHAAGHAAGRQHGRPAPRRRRLRRAVPRESVRRPR